MKVEHNSLVRKCVWTVIDLPHLENLDTKWVLKGKTSQMRRYKTRLVVSRFHITC